jgi:hypothetical protein
VIDINRRGITIGIVLTTMIILNIFFSGCLNDTSTKDKSGPDKNEKIIPETDEKDKYVIKENKEAELMALYLSGELTAPDNLYLKICNDLNEIRSTFNFSKRFKVITFFPPWFPRIRIKFNESMINEIKNGNYSEWDELNNKYNVTEIETQLLTKYHYVILHFNYSYNPRVLSKLYEDLSGVIFANPSSNGGYHNIYPKKVGDDISYLFFAGWGDCPSGCIYEEYWYFKFENNQPILVGNWNNEEDPEVPDWWNKAKINIAEFNSERFA